MLERLAPDLARDLLAARRGAAGQKGSTLMFARLADTLHNWFGRTWLANEIALIAATSPELRAGHGAARGAPSFGVEARPSALIRDVAANRKQEAWWRTTRDAAVDQLDLLTWTVALIVGADRRVVDTLRRGLAETVAELDDVHYGVASAAIARLGRRLGSSLPHDVVIRAATDDSRSGALLAEVAADEDRPIPKMDGGTGRWEVIRALSTWNTLRPGAPLDPADARLLASAGAGLQLGPEKDWMMPEALVRAVQPASPWGLIIWRDRDHESRKELPPLELISAEQDWS